ncbi:MarR family winged helix-turn-helix transcriptional regulator [Antarcticimicrobium luteum]|uniref:MarR family transcriptional regulator n=1 Tax=Antarcticimicrobium luteum TaxID=2547397 RepID=A0A4R5V7L5_9RHOB|nr:MarR family winged helix-turn-helix transcriptional regulator [Antarcticimicrobium luteum]TDK48032.1 MarR family transcriptional regulator [Antarcticimicrobium luteum]
MASRDDEMRDFLYRAGIESGAVDSALEIDAVMQQWRRRFRKRELGASALRDLKLDDRLDLAQLDVLIAIWAPSKEFTCKAGQETMVATVAERLAIDPSRASRLISDLIARGLARRAVSQQDARRTIVELTEGGKAIVRAVRRYKFLLMGDFLSGWTPEERATFLPLLDRFSKWTDEAPNMASDHFVEEIAALVAALPPVDGG